MSAATKARSSWAPRRPVQRYGRPASRPTTSTFRLRGVTAADPHDRAPDRARIWRGERQLPRVRRQRDVPKLPGWARGPSVPYADGVPLRGAGVSSEIASRALPWDDAPATAGLFGDGVAAAGTCWFGRRISKPTITATSCARSPPAGRRSTITRTLRDPPPERYSAADLPSSGVNTSHVDE